MMVSLSKYAFCPLTLPLVPLSCTTDYVCLISPEILGSTMELTRVDPRILARGANG